MSHIAQFLVAWVAIWHAFAVDELEVYFVLWQLWYIVLEIQCQVVSLLLWGRYPTQLVCVVYEVHAAAHGGEADPRVGSWHQFAHEFHIQSQRIALAVVDTRIAYAHVVHGVALHAVDEFSVGFCGELEWSSPCAEIVVGTQYQLP